VLVFCHSVYTFTFCHAHSQGFEGEIVDNLRDITEDDLNTVEEMKVIGNPSGRDWILSSTWRKIILPAEDMGDFKVRNC
jgi:hypothetical protein